MKNLINKIQNGEVVFGLQRPFKTAGAKSIIMRLCKVPDQQTQELMDMFYSNWLTVKSKRDSSRESQQTMKSKYPKPIYGGGFVLVGEQEIKF